MAKKGSKKARKVSTSKSAKRAAKGKKPGARRGRGAVINPIPGRRFEPPKED